MLEAIVLAALISIAPPQQPAPATTYQLAAVQVGGAKRYTAEDVARLGGLAVGTPLAIADLQPAADRLVSSGLFKELRYRYTTAAKRITVVFDFEEAEWTVPVVFDNFVWLSDDEIAAAVRGGVPSFDGTSPATEGAPELIRSTLQELMARRKLAGTVTFVPHTDLKTQAVRYLFAVKDPAPRVCAVEIAGASPGREADLADATRALVGADYSRFYTTNMAQGTLLDIYQRHGHWKAAFSAPRTSVSAAACEGVTVVLPVDEGPVYRWGKAVWSGNAAVAPGVLDSRLGLAQGDIADGAKLRAGLLSITRAYGRIGHVLAQATPTPQLDDGSRTAVFTITIDEGPQFRMGTVEFVGIPDAAAQTLKERWTLAPGAVYDDTYAASFYGKEVSPRRPAGGKAPEMQTEINRSAGVVNVRFLFK